MQRSESVLSIGLIIVLVIIVLLQFINLGLSLTGYYLGKDAEISDSDKSDKQNKLYFFTMRISVISMALVAIIGIMTRKKRCLPSNVKSNTNSYVKNIDVIDDDEGLSTNGEGGDDYRHSKRSSSFSSPHYFNPQLRSSKSYHSNLNNYESSSSTKL